MAEFAGVQCQENAKTESARISLLSSGDLKALLALFSRAIPHTQLKRSIYLAHGVEKYLECLLQWRELQGHEQFWGLKNESGLLIAAAHTRTFRYANHLNNFAVDPAFQGRGLGSRMLEYWESLANSQDVKLLSLDVAHENEGARKLYLRWGFREESITHEFMLDRPIQMERRSGVVLRNWPQASVQCEMFGFGRFQIECSGRSNPVDLLPDRFRIYQPSEWLVDTLQTMDSHRTIVLCHYSPLQSDSWRHTGSIIRMIKDCA